MWLRMSSYFNDFMLKDENSDSPMQVDVDFFKDSMDFLVIRNLGSRYRGSWFIRSESLPPDRHFIMGT